MGFHSYINSLFMLFLYNYKARINLIRHEGKFINIIKKN